MSLSPEDLSALRDAKSALENPSFAARLTNVIGKPIERGFDWLPESFSTAVQTATQKSLHASLKVAVSSLGKPRRFDTDFFHKAAATVSGGAGGALGLQALAIELPVTTTLMLRSIADIARSEGEELQDTLTQLACLEVFALGGASPDDDGAETGYYAVRTVLSQSIADAAAFLIRTGVADSEAPVLMKLLAALASRFGIVVSEKAAAQMVPVVGGIGGATVNLVFMDHFQRVAHGHFTVRRLERHYGADVVRDAYEQL